MITFHKSLGGVSIHEIPNRMLSACIAIHAIAFSLEQHTNISDLVSLNNIVIHQENGYNVLDLSRNNLTNIAGIDTFEVILKQSPTPFKDVPKSILRLNNNQLQSLPAEIANLSNLTVLEVNHNQLTSLPNIGRLKQLTRLEVSFNRLKSLPDSIASIKGLQHLEASHNLITLLPVRFGNLKQLSFCSLQYNELQSLPASFIQLAHLKQLDLSNNRLRDSDLELVMHCKKLTRLLAHRNTFTTISETLGQCSELQELGIAHNQLTTLPEVLGKLHLIDLDISYNALTNDAIPAYLANNAKLVTLYY